METSFGLIPPMMKRDVLYEILMEEGREESALFALQYESSEEAKEKFESLRIANSGLFLYLIPDDQAALVGKRRDRLEITGRLTYLAWKGHRLKVLKHLFDNSSPKNAAEALAVFLEVKSGLRISDDDRKTPYGIADTAFDGIVSAFRSVGVDNIYEILGVVA